MFKILYLVFVDLNTQSHQEDRTVSNYGISWLTSEELNIRQGLSFL